MSIEYMGNKASVSSEELSRHNIAHAFFFLRDISHMIAVRVQYHVLIGLLKSTITIRNKVSSRNGYLQSDVEGKGKSKTHTITFINSNCLCTTSPEFANMLTAG